MPSKLETVRGALEPAVQETTEEHAAETIEASADAGDVVHEVTASVEIEEVNEGGNSQHHQTRLAANSFKSRPRAESDDGMQLPPQPKQSPQWGSNKASPATPQMLGRMRSSEQVDCQSRAEVINDRALAVLVHVEKKLTGKDFNTSNGGVDVREQVPCRCYTMVNDCGYRFKG